MAMTCCELFVIIPSVHAHLQMLVYRRDNGSLLRSVYLPKFPSAIYLNVVKRLNKLRFLSPFRLILIYSIRIDWIS